MEAHDPRVQSKIFAVVTAHAFHIEFLPAVSVFGVGRVSIFLFERSDIGIFLFVTGINTRADTQLNDGR